MKPGYYIGALLFLSILGGSNLVTALKSNEELQQLKQAQRDDRIEISLQKDMLRRFKNPEEVAKHQANYQQLLKMYRDPNVKDEDIDKFIKKIEEGK